MAAYLEGLLQSLLPSSCHGPIGVFLILACAVLIVVIGSGGIRQSK